MKFYHPVPNNIPDIDADQLLMDAAYGKIRSNNLNEWRSLKSLRSLKREQQIGLLFVIVLHGAGLYALWSYRILPTPVDAFVMVSSLIDPPPQPPKPEISFHVKEDSVPYRVKRLALSLRSGH